MAQYVNSYIVLLIFIGLGIILPIAALSVGRLLRPHRPNRVKLSPYESGADPVGQSWVRFHVRYYMFALLFVIFDIESLFLLPWAVAFDSLGLFALIEMGIFVIMLLIGLIYAWRKKVLKWV